MKEQNYTTSIRLNIGGFCKIYNFKVGKKFQRKTEIINRKWTNYF